MVGFQSQGNLIELHKSPLFDRNFLFQAGVRLISINMWLFFEKQFLLPMQMPLNCIPLSTNAFHFMSWIKSAAFSRPRLCSGNYGEIFNRVCIIRKQHCILKSSHKLIKICSVLLWYMEFWLHRSFSNWHILFHSCFPTWCFY